jgi:prevent-host-death family protein
MTIAISMNEARENFSDLVNRVAYGKERIPLTRRNKTVAFLVSVDDVKLMEYLEDRQDIKDIEAALKGVDPKKDAIPLADVIAELDLK